MTGSVRGSTAGFAAALVCLAAALAPVSAARAAEAPIKEVFSRSLGWEVDKTTKGDICTAESKDACGPGLPSSQPGGFEYPEGIAVDTDPSSPQYGDVYIGERSNDRIDEFTASGEFVAMFGWEVNKTTKANICSAASHDLCGAGVQGTGAGQFDGSIKDLVFDPVTGSLYVRETEGNQRVERYTPEGQFVWMSGKEVDKTKTAIVKALEAKGGTPTPIQLEEEDLCSAASGDECQAGTPGSSGHNAFDGYSEFQNTIAVGGPKDLLYVGDDGRVQELEADGHWKGETALPGTVQALAVDGSGDLYVVYVELPTTVHELNASGMETNSLTVRPREAGAQEITIDTIALDSAGQLAVSELERGGTVEGNKFFGSLYSAASGRRITEFQLPSTFPTHDLTFDSAGNLYGAMGEEGQNEAFFYTHKAVAELLTSPSGECVPGASAATDVTLNCSLNAMVDPWGVKETEAWFEWGRSASLGELTEPLIAVGNEPGKKEGEAEALVKVSAPLEGLRPNETFYFRLAGHDQNVKQPELLSSEPASFSTPSVPPRIVGEPSASPVHAFSAVLLGEVNPENTSTTYEFQYAPSEACQSLKEGCAGVRETASLNAAEYGPIGTALEASGLQPATSYRYRLFATNAAGEALDEEGLPALPEATFTTSAQPAPYAVSGTASAIGTNSATVSGTVDPDGEPVSYAFEVGVYAGAQTIYGTVFSGSAVAGSTPVEESLGIVGLQPGTTYAYRIAISSGYIENEAHTLYGEPVAFTTAGLPSVLVLPGELAQLATPATAFPEEPAKVTPKKLTRAQRLARALKACAKKPKRERASCQRNARERYRANAKSKKKK